MEVEADIEHVEMIAYEKRLSHNLVLILAVILAGVGDSE
eukprot:SAG11_NODE_50_length_19992_cov_9.945157_12_plen_39_part_00